MVIKIKTSADLPYSEVTPEAIYKSRREFLAASVIGVVGGIAGGIGAEVTEAAGAVPQAALAAKKTAFVTDPAVDPQSTWETITTYNNYYEFGTGKDDPARTSGRLTTKPWSVKVDGLVDKPGDYGLEDLVDFKNLEERIYRLRCVEAWSMVIPWIGVPLSSLIRKAQPKSTAAFVEFTTLQRPSEMPGLMRQSLDWPYREGLRMDEAMHPLTLAVVGVYGKVLPNQNGAPLRVHSPWKYGFKGGKSIVRMRFTDKMPATSWAMQTPHEYGFYANVNPTVDHPRWTQAREVRLPGFFKNRPTLMFNGYGDQVASLYAGMDLKKFY